MICILERIGNGYRASIPEIPGFTVTATVLEGVGDTIRIALLRHFKERPADLSLTFKYTEGHWSFESPAAIVMSFPGTNW